MSATPYLTFTRADWAPLRDATPLPLSEDDLAALRGLNEPVSLREVTDVYLPVSRLLNLHVAAVRGLRRAMAAFLDTPLGEAPYLIGIAGSVAAGKSTTARILQALLARWPDHPRVDLVTTDGFLYPNQVLDARGLMRRKGFPESYDLRRLVRFVVDVKAGHAEVAAPVYSHVAYDVLPDRAVLVRRPDILILEGLNVLQRDTARRSSAPHVFVSDFFDFSVYVHAEEPHLERWYVERFLRLRETTFRDQASYFRHYAGLSVAEATAVAERLWREINAVNLRENILPTKERASLVLEKGEDHAVERVRLRRF